MLKYAKEYKMNLIKLLKKYRLENKLSQQKLAKMLKVHYTTICEWESGKRKPNEIWAFHIEKFLKQKGVMK